LVSYDWGGWTQLKVVAELSDHSTVTAHVRGLPQQTLAVPKDDDGNHIADGWEQQYNVSNLDPASDEDTIPSNGNTGDGIALYDEYRGFHVGGNHTRLSPLSKDLFIRDFDKLTAATMRRPPTSTCGCCRTTKRRATRRATPRAARRCTPRLTAATARSL
jgi:hypothetical protein